MNSTTNKPNSSPKPSIWVFGAPALIVCSLWSLRPRDIRGVSEGPQMKQFDREVRVLLCVLAVIPTTIDILSVLLTFVNFLLLPSSLASF